MQKEATQAYYCPFAKEMCKDGVMPRGKRLVNCQFWDSDYSRRGLLWSISGLKELGAISSALQTLAAK